MRVFALAGETRGGRTIVTVTGRLAFGLTVVALVWSVAFFVGSVPLVADESATVLFLAAFPAAVTATVWMLLHRRCTRATGTAAAWALVAVLWAFSVVSLASLGLFVLPVVALLGLATAFTPAAPAPRRPRG